MGKARFSDDFKRDAVHQIGAIIRVNLDPETRMTELMAVSAIRQMTFGDLKANSDPARDLYELMGSLLTSFGCFDRGIE